MTDELKRGTQLGKYELLVRIGRGGMATVWVALERGSTPDQDRLVAVKAILADLAGDPEFTKMFLDEGRLVQSIAHEAVVEVYEVGEANEVMFMSMEWVEGDSLHALIAEAGKRRPIPPEMAVRAIADVAGGLHAAHEVRGDDGELLGLVHRDVSPHNILIGTNGAVKLVDFGVAKAMGRLSDATQAGQLKGKFGYMSPEQARGKPIDRRSDVFSLGIVLFELTTGRRLFRGQHDAETLHLVVSGDIPEPRSIDPEYPEKLQAIVMKALERNLEDRYQTALEVREALEQYLKDERIIVPSKGLASLLKRVLGKRIEQRRKAIRAALKARDDDSAAMPSSDGLSSHGREGTGSGVTGTGSGITGSGITGSGVTGTGSGVTGSGVTGTGVSAPSQPSVSGYSQPSSSTGAHMMPRRERGGLAGYVIGIAGLLVAVVVVLVFALRGGGTTTSTTIVQPAAQPAEAPGPEPDQPKSKPEGDDLPTLSIDALDSDDAGTAAAAAPRTGPRTAPAPGPAAPAAKPAAPAQPPTTKAPRESPYRDNPYR